MSGVKLLPACSIKILLIYVVCVSTCFITRKTSSAGVLLIEHFRFSIQVKTSMKHIKTCEIIKINVQNNEHLNTIYREGWLFLKFLQIARIDLFENFSLILKMSVKT